MGTCCGCGPLLADIDTYTNGLHTPHEDQAHQLVVTTCVNQNRTTEVTTGFLLQPGNDTVSLEFAGALVPWNQSTATVRDRTVGQDQVVVGPLAGNGVQLSSGFDVDNGVTSYETPGMGGPTAVSRRTPNAAGVARHQADQDIANAILNNAALAVLIVDMAAGLYERYGGEFVFQAQRRVIQQAIAAGRPILEVVMYNPYAVGLTPTHGLLTSLFWNYDNLTVFKKPGTGSAASRSCVECENVVRDDAQKNITAAPARLVPQTLVQHLDANHITHLVVMGYDANTCVGGTIFGRLSRGPSGVNADAPPASVHTWEYEKGLLDYGFNIYSSRNLLGSGGARLGTGYTT